MSNMAKKGKVEVEGFLHDVSNMIQSGDRCKYFTALLQEAQRNCRVVIFDHMKHNRFRSAEKDRTPVKLCDVTFSPSRQKKGEMDVVVNSSSSVRCVRQLDFVFDESLHEVVQDVTVDYILKDPREYQRVNVTVKIVRMTEDEVCVTRSLQKMKKRCYDVADNTHGIALCVWGGDILANGKCYYVTNVSVRQFGGETSITTTAQSEMTVLDLDMEVHGAVSNVKVFEGQLLTAEVKVEYKCPKQHLLQNVNLETAITRCHQCGAYCKTAAVVAVLRTKVTIEDSSGKMTEFGIEDYVLRQLLNLGSERRFETDLLVSKLLVEDRIQLQGRGNRITAAAFLPPCAPSTNERDRATESAPTASCSTAVLPPCAPSTNERDLASESAPTASCSTPQESEDDLMLEEFFRSETVELDGVNQKETEKVEVDGKGTMLDCKRKESVKGTVEKEVEGSARPKQVKCDRNLKQPVKTAKKK